MGSLPKSHLSHSQINMFLRCPKQYEFRYLEGLVMPPSGNLILGGAGHKALEHNYSQKIDSKKDLKETEVTEYFASEFEERAKEEVDWQDNKPGDLKDGGVRVLKEYQKTTAPLIQPRVVEYEFNIEFENVDYTLKGFIDLITEKSEVRDHKISGRSPSTVDDLQLTVYKIAYRYLMGHDPTLTTYDYLITTKKPQVKMFPVEITEADEAEYFTLVGEVVGAIGSGCFYRRTNGWWCGAKYCGYYHKCRPHKNKTFYEFTKEVSDGK